VPGLAGFFSKDEILYEAFHEGHTILWTIGITTSLLTATYMFRLVFLTFHGDPASARQAAQAARPDVPSAHPEEEEHGAHHGHLHDAPPAMAAALVVLAIGAVLAGYIGIPHALGGHNALGTWLAPSFAPPGLAEAAGAGGVVEAGGEVDSATELALMLVSSLIAVAGIGLAVFLWLKRREVPARLAERFPGAYRLLLNKYYVDELYDAAVVRPIVATSREGLWRGVDVKIIDGAVNGAGAIVAGGAWVLRRLQTGSVRAYAGGVFVGAVLVIGYYLWR
jgi:NADH-quinone oxidoreductase subunit L